MDYKACRFMEKGICFDQHSLVDCCIGLDCDRRGKPVIIDHYEGKVFDWNEIFEIKEKRNQYVKTVGVPPVCEGCGYLTESYDFSGDRKFAEVIYQNVRTCNSRCIYCSDSYYSNLDSYDALPATKDFIKKGFLEKNALITFQGGEPTMMKNFNKIAELFLKQNAKIRVNSSGIIYHDSIYKGIKSGNLKLVVSIDSGTRELYKKIKRVDKFDKLLKNLKKYSSVLKDFNNDCLTLKYIIIPGVNDSVQDIDNWLNLTKNIGIKSIIIDSECVYTTHSAVFPDYMYFLEDYVRYRSEQLGFSFDMNIFIINANNKRTSPVYDFNNFDLTEFSALIEDIKQKYKSQNLLYSFNI